jgi:hypothetical protein
MKNIASKGRTNHLRMSDFNPIIMLQKPKTTPLAAKMPLVYSGLIALVYRGIIMKINMIIGIQKTKANLLLI